MKRSASSKNGVLLIEIVIAAAVFSVCLAVAASVFGIAARELKYSENLSAAQQAAVSIAESYKGGADIYSIKNDFADCGFSLNLSESREGAVALLSITVSDAEYEYIRLTCARRDDYE